MKFRMHTRVPSLSCLTASLLASAGSAQTAPMAQQVMPATSQGHFSAWAVAVSGQGIPSAVAVHIPGDLTPPDEWNAATFGPANPDHPDYSDSALLSWVPAGSSLPKFSGISSGGDVTPRVTAEGVLASNASTWYALNISVKHGARGLPGSMIAQRSQLSSTPEGSDIYSYYAPIPPGAGINTDFSDTVRLEYKRAQLVVGTEVDNIDFGSGIIALDRDNKVGPMVPVRNWIYFTLPRSWVIANPILLGGAIVDEATIYRMEWTSTGWSAPQVAYSRAELFSLPSGSEGGGGEGQPNPPIDLEIDAISVYQFTPESGPPHDRVVFSLTAGSHIGSTYFDPILVFQRAVNGYPACTTKALQVVVDGQTHLVSDRLGLFKGSFDPLHPEVPIDPDDPDGTCGLDPRRNEFGTGSYVGPVLGMIAEDPEGHGQVGISSMRMRFPDPANPGESLDTVRVQVSGITAPGYDDAYIELLAHDEQDIPSNLIHSWVADQVAQDEGTVSYSWTIPASDGEKGPARVTARLWGVKWSPFKIKQLRDSFCLELFPL